MRAVLAEALDLLAADPLEAAPGLLGGVLTAKDEAGQVSVRLTEVEAYRGAHDPGSHAFKGMTARNATMFAEAGTVYVYLTYGMHHCVNLVCGPQGLARAILLRAGQVVEGHALARQRRASSRTEHDLARGPALLCQALGLTRADDGLVLGEPGARLSLRLPSPQERPEPATVRTGPRTGVSGPGGDGTAFPWRFWLKGEPSVSPYKPARPRPPRRQKR